MKRIKELLKRIKTKIKESQLAINLSILAKIKKYKDKLDDYEAEKKRFIDELTNIRLEGDRYKKIADRIPVYDYSLKKSCKLLKDYIYQLRKAKRIIADYESKIFDLELQVKGSKVQIEEYLHTIEDLKSDRYLVRKLPPGKTPNTNKTKISKPMSARVTNYMRNEHE